MKNLKNKIAEKLVAVAATAVMVFSLCNMLSFAGEEDTAEMKYKNSVVQSQLTKWLGELKEYGVVAEKATVNIDFESNIATNMLYTNGATMWASVIRGFVEEGKDLYIKDFEGPLKIARRGETEFVLYTGLTIEGERNNQRVYFVEKNNNTTYLNTDDYAYMPVWNCVNYKGEDVLDIASELNRVNNIFSNYDNYIAQKNKHK